MFDEARDRGFRSYQQGSSRSSASCNTAEVGNDRETELLGCSRLLRGLPAHGLSSFERACYSTRRREGEARPVLLLPRQQRGPLSLCLGTPAATGFEHHR